MSETRPDHAALSHSGRAIWLRRDAEKITGSLPPLLAEASQLAHVLASGLHGRKRAGPGEDFWQFRQALPGDPASAIDWRRSGRGDALFLRDREWETAQTVSIWADAAQSMNFKGPDSDRTKGERARLLALSLAILLSSAGERVALLGTAARQPRNGETQMQRMAMELARESGKTSDYGSVPLTPLPRGSRAVFLSDFLGPDETIFPVLARAADSGVKGCLVQILDASEEAFPFDGRTVFQSMAGTIDFETQRARALRTAYLERLAARRARLQDSADRNGWRAHFHRTNESPRKALLWLYMGIGVPA